jgi:hypothetical protein
MSKLGISLYGISLILLFSPAFLFLLLKRAGLFYPTFETQIVSVLPFILGVAILAFLKLRKVE